MSEIWSSQATNLTFCSAFSTLEKALLKQNHINLFPNNTLPPSPPNLIFRLIKKKTSQTCDTRLDRWRGRLIQCAAKQQVYTWPNWKIQHWIWVRFLCWSPHWLCYVCFHYSCPPAGLYKPAWACKMEELQVAPVASLKTTPPHEIFSNISTSRFLWSWGWLQPVQSAVRCSLAPLSTSQNNIIYSIVTLLSITCLSSSTFSWSSIISSQ